MSLASDLTDFVIASKVELADTKSQLVTALSNDAADAETIATAKAAADAAIAELATLKATNAAMNQAATTAAEQEAALAAAIAPPMEITPSI